MREILREPAPWVSTRRYWHFLEDAGAYYMYVKCEQSIVSFPLMVKLTDDEYSEYHGLGWSFLNYFAEKINYWPSRFTDRNVSPEVRARAEAAISESISGPLRSA